MSQGHNNTTAGMKVSKLCIGTCDTLEGKASGTKLPMFCSAGVV